MEHKPMASASGSSQLAGAAGMGARGGFVRTISRTTLATMFFWLGVA